MKEKKSLDAAGRGKNTNHESCARLFLDPSSVRLSFSFSKYPSVWEVLYVLTLLLYKQISLHSVLANALVFMWVLLHFPHQRLHLRPCALKTVPCLNKDEKNMDQLTKSDVYFTRNLCALYLTETWLQKEENFSSNETLLSLTLLLILIILLVALFRGGEWQQSIIPGGQKIPFCL